MDPQLAELLKDNQVAQLLLILVVIYLLIQVTKAVSDGLRTLATLFGWLHKRDEAEAQDDSSRNEQLQQVLSLLGMVLGPIREAVQQSNVVMARSVETMGRTAEAVAGLDNTIKSYQATVTDLQGQSASTRQAIQDHDTHAQEYFKAVTAQGEETLAIVRDLPAKVDAVSAAVEQLRKDAIDRLETVHLQTREHIDTQFVAARLSIDASFSTMTSALLAQLAAQAESETPTPDPQPEPPAPEPPPAATIIPLDNSATANSDAKPSEVDAAA